jgi:small subunit ribosomal protein S16
MLAIRMQRTGRKGHAMFRVVVQESRLTPTSGKVVALLGSYDPHSKTSTLVKDKAEFYLSHGAQPSERVIRLLEQEGVKLPKWVKKSADKKRDIRNPEKLRRNQPKEAPKAEEAPAEEPEAPVAEEIAEAPAEETAEA